MRYTKSTTQNAVVVSRKSNYRCSSRNRDIMQRRSSFPCELREFLWCKNICFQNRLDVSKQILECYHYSLIDVRVSRNNCVDISSFFFLIGWLLFLSLKKASSFIIAADNNFKKTASLYKKLNPLHNLPLVLIISNLANKSLMFLISRATQKQAIIYGKHVCHFLFLQWLFLKGVVLPGRWACFFDVKSIKSERFQSHIFDRLPKK